MLSYTEDERRFWQRVKRQPGDGCWEWQGSISKNGYGQVVRHYKSELVHRVAYELAYGPITAGRFICHICNNRRCVRPDHLFIGTHEQNYQDMAEKGRVYHGDRRKARMPRGAEHCTQRRPESISRGEMRSDSKLTEEQVRDMRRRHCAGASFVELSLRYGVARSTVGDAVMGKTWSHVV